MNRWFLLAGALTLLPGTCLAEETKPSSYVHPELLVETGWLDENIIRPELLLLDLRARDVYDQGHIPGSYWLDDNSLVKHDGHVPTPPPPDEFKALMESVGIGGGVRVIAVDDIGGRSAARLWWTLGYYGFDNVSVLNGGYAKWEAEGRSATYEYPFHRAAVFTPRARPERAATAEQVLDWKKTRPSGVILDARSLDEFEGKTIRLKRPGHIPGAISFPWDEAFVTQKDVRVYKPASELLALLAKAGVTKDSQVVVYCQDNHRASHVLLTMALMGLGGANYVGAWGEWSGRPDLPVEGPKVPAKPAPSKTGEPARTKAGTKTPTAP